METKKDETTFRKECSKSPIYLTVIHKPPLWSLDEPFSGFDPEMRKIHPKMRFWPLKKKETTVILSTHRMESVELLCDKVAMINRSKKISRWDPIKQVKIKLSGLKFISITIDHLIQHDSPRKWAAKQDDSSFHFTLPIKWPNPNQLLHEWWNMGNHAVPRSKFQVWRRFLFIK